MQTLDFYDSTVARKSDDWLNYRRLCCTTLALAPATRGVEAQEQMPPPLKTLDRLFWISIQRLWADWRACQLPPVTCGRLAPPLVSASTGKYCPAGNQAENQPAKKFAN